MTDARQPTDPTTPRRRRGRRRPGLLIALAPPAAILACAGAAFAYRLTRADWQGVRVFSPPARANRAPEPAAPPAPSPLSGGGQVVARVKADPDLLPFDFPPIPAAPAPVEITSTRPLPEPVAPEPFVQPKTPEPISKEEALAAIAREADQLRAGRRLEAGLKAGAAARELADTRRRQAEQARRALRFVEEDRHIFRDDLSRLLARGGSKVAQQIEDLCQRRKTAMPPELRRAFDQARVTVSARLDRRDRVEFYRRRGIPEETILFELANEELAQVGLRHGPRNRDGALLRGARRLLDVPLPAPCPAAIADAAAHPGNAPAASP